MSRGGEVAIAINGIARVMFCSLSPGIMRGDDMEGKRGAQIFDKLVNEIGLGIVIPSGEGGRKAKYGMS